MNKRESFKRQPSKKLSELQIELNNQKIGAVAIAVACYEEKNMKKRASTVSTSVSNPEVLVKRQSEISIQRAKTGQSMGQSTSNTSTGNQPKNQNRNLSTISDITSGFNPLQQNEENESSITRKLFCASSLPFLVVFIGFFFFVLIFLWSAFWINQKSSKEDPSQNKMAGVDGENLQANFRNFSFGSDKIE